jgi:hypothetical protein
MSGLRDDFLELFRLHRSFRLSAIDQAYQRASIGNDSAAMAALGAERQELLDLPAKVDTDDRKALVAMWPAGLGEIPLWFADPEAAKKIDPPSTKTCVVDLAEAPVPPEIDLNLNTDLIAKAYATRLERKPADDQAMEVYRGMLAERWAQSKTVLAGVNAKRKLKRWPELSEDEWKERGEDPKEALRNR